MTVATDPIPTIIPEPTSRVRLAYTDGMRGVGACLVALHHLYLRIQDSAGPHSVMARWTKFAVPGHSVVGVFLVLSGYSLMISIAKDPHFQLAGGWPRYFRRRAWRIIPSYYAGLAVSIAPLLPRWIGWPHLPWKSAAPVDLSMSSVVAHLLMIHNFRPDWVRQINAAYWSIATEWQMYFAFPLLLLPIWRKFGSTATIAFGLIAGVLIGRATGMQIGACPWYLGLFAMGMAGSYVSFGKSNHPRRLGPIGWGWIAAGFLFALTIDIWFVPLWFPLSDALAGLGAMALMVACTDRCKTDLAGQTGGVVALLKVLEWRPIAGIGRASYSLYLIHGPIINLTAMLLAWLCGATSSSQLWLMPLLTIPIIAIAVSIFHVIFDRPFMTNRNVGENPKSQKPNPNQIPSSNSQ